MFDYVQELYNRYAAPPGLLDDYKERIRTKFGMADVDVEYITRAAGSILQRRAWCEYYDANIRKSFSLYNTFVDAYTKESELSVIQDIIPVLLSHRSVAEPNLQPNVIEYLENNNVEKLTNEDIHDIVDTSIATYIYDTNKDDLFLFFNTFFELLLEIVPLETILWTWTYRMLNTTDIYYPMNGSYRVRLLNTIRYATQHFLEKPEDSIDVNERSLNISGVIKQFELDRKNKKVPYTFLIELIRQTFTVDKDLFKDIGGVDLHQTKEVWHGSSQMARSFWPKKRDNDYFPEGVVSNYRGLGKSKIGKQEIYPWGHSGSFCRNAFYEGAVNDANIRVRGCGYSYKPLYEENLLNTAGCGISYSTNLFFWSFITLLVRDASNVDRDGVLSTYSNKEIARNLFFGISTLMILDGGHTFSEVVGLIKHVCVYLLYIRMPEKMKNERIVRIIAQLYTFTNTFFLFGRTSDSMASTYRNVYREYVPNFIASRRPFGQAREMVRQYINYVTTVGMQMPESTSLDHQSVLEQVFDKYDDFAQYLRTVLINVLQPTFQVLSMM